MNVFFYKKEDEEDCILQYESCSYNNIPRIGEKVIIENKWYLIEDIVNIYRKPASFTFTVIYIYLKVVEN